MRDEFSENAVQPPDDFYDWGAAGEPELLVTEAQEAALATFSDWMDAELACLEQRYAHLAAPGALKFRPNLSLTRKKRKAK